MNTDRFDLIPTGPSSVKSKIETDPFNTGFAPVPKPAGPGSDQSFALLKISTKIVLSVGPNPRPWGFMTAL